VSGFEAAVGVSSGMWAGTRTRTGKTLLFGLILGGGEPVHLHSLMPPTMILLPLEVGWQSEKAEVQLGGSHRPDMTDAEYG
jgi:hypothetical protein